MALRNQKRKKLFIGVIHGKKHDDHRVLINERFFNLNDMGKWRIYTKLILQHVNYLHEINNKDFDLFLREVIKQVNDESKQFKRKMSYLLGDWNESAKIR